MRKVAVGGLVALGSVAGARLLRRRAQRGPRLDVYYEDGSMVSLRETMPEAAAALARAREALGAARGR